MNNTDFHDYYFLAGLEEKDDHSKGGDETFFSFFDLQRAFKFKQEEFNALQKESESLKSHLKLYLQLLATKTGTDAEFVEWCNKAEELTK